MFFENQYRDNQPIASFRGFPIYLTTLIVAFIVAGLLVSAFVGFYTAFEWFAFLPAQFWQRGQVWRLFGYLAVDQVSFFTLFNLVFLYSFGRDCEREMGRRRYLGFLAVLVATPVLVASLLWLLGIGGGVIGTMHLAIGLVIAFATIYPDAAWLASIPMKFVALGCMLLAAVGHLSQRDTIGLMSTLATCAVSFGYIRGMRTGLFAGFSWRLQSHRPRETAPTREKEAPRGVDDLLDKIAQSGFQSLTPEDKQRLEAARQELIRRERR